MFLFRDNKAKAEVKVIEFTQNVSANTFYDTNYTKDISSYIDNADSYVIVSAAMKITRNGYTDTNETIEKWLPLYVHIQFSGTGALQGFGYYPGVALYNSGSKAYVRYGLFNDTSKTRPVKFRVAMMRAADAVSV